MLCVHPVPILDLILARRECSRWFSLGRVTRPGARVGEVHPTSPGLSGEEALQGKLGYCHPRTGRYAEEKQKWKLTAVPYRRGLAGPKERLDVEGQGTNRTNTNQAVLSVWPLTLGPMRLCEHDSAGVLQLRKTFPLFPNPALL